VKLLPIIYQFIFIRMKFSFLFILVNLIIAKFEQYYKKLLLFDRKHFLVRIYVLFLIFV